MMIVDDHRARAGLGLGVRAGAVVALVAAVLLAAGLVLARPAAAAPVPVFSISGAVPVGSNPIAVAVSPDGTRAYVTNTGDGTLSVIDTGALAEITRIVVGSGPFHVAVSLDGSRVYVANQGSNTVSVIDAGANAVIATVPVGIGPWAVAVAPDGTRVYVTNSGDGTLSVIDAGGNTVIGAIAIGAGPSGLALSGDGSFAYVAAAGDGAVSVIDTAGNAVVGTIPVGGTPIGVGIASGGFAYVANGADDTVTVIDTATNTAIGTIPVGRAPFFVFVYPAGPFVLVPNLGDGTTSVIDTSTNTVVDTIALGAPAGLAYSPDGAVGYATDQGNNQLVILSIDDGLATVTFDANGGAGTMAPQSAERGTAATLSPNSFTRPQHAFAGWNTAADGTGTAYPDQATFAFAADTTLYAQWEAPPPPARTVTFDANGGAGIMAAQSSQAPAALRPNMFTRDRFAFAGWNTAADGSGTAYADQAVFGFAGDATLYAQWRPIAATPAPCPTPPTAAPPTSAPGPGAATPPACEGPNLAATGAPAQAALAAAGLALAAGCLLLLGARVVRRRG